MEAGSAVPAREGWQNAAVRRTGMARPECVGWRCGQPLPPAW